MYGKLLIIHFPMRLIGSWISFWFACFETFQELLQAIFPFVFLAFNQSGATLKK